MFRHESDEEKKMKMRASLTTRVWICATFMMAIVVRGFDGSQFAQLLAFLSVLGAAGIGTAAVWGAFENRSRTALPPTPDNLRELEERLANLEMINSYERRLELESKADSYDSVQERRAKMSLR